MYVCMYVRTYVRTYVCIYLYIYIYYVHNIYMYIYIFYLVYCYYIISGCKLHGRQCRRVAGSLWNTVWSVTLEHRHFSLTLEHKMIHIIKTMPTTQTWDLLTGALLWKPGAFQSEVRTRKRPPMKIIVVRKPSIFKMRTLTHLRTLIISHSCSSGVGWGN